MELSRYTRPQALKPGDTIGVIAMSAASEETRFRRGIEALERYGYRAKIALDPTADYGRNQFLFASARPEERARGFESLYLDPEVKAILSVRGAYGSAEALPLIRWEALQAAVPKPMIGFSDTTAVLLALTGCLRTLSIHGPSSDSSFSKAHESESARRSAETLLQLLSGELSDPMEQLAFQPLKDGTTGEGILLGGNLSVVASLVGTRFLPSLKGAVLFLEEIGEKPYRVHRMLLQLKMSGAFDGLKGVALGSFRNCVHAAGLPPTLDEVFRDIFGGCPFPVLQDGRFGHEDLNLPVPLGVRARISGERLELLEPAILK